MNSLLLSDVVPFRFAFGEDIAELRVRQFWGEEGISRLFHFSIELESENWQLDTAKVIGKEANFQIRSLDHNRLISGIVSRFEFLTLDAERGVALYNADLVPEEFILSHGSQSRIFQNQNAPDILKQVLASGGIRIENVKFMLTDSYKPIDYCVQYRESDLDFFNRIAEQYGIFYFFRFAEESTNLVIADSPESHEPVPPDGEIVYGPNRGLLSDSERMTDFRLSKSIRPTRTTVRDFNFESPALNLTKEASVTETFSIEIYDYPGKFLNESSGSRVAKIRQEAEECAKIVGSGRSDSVRLAPGATFKLSTHPISEFNREYLVREITHSGAQPTIDSVGPASIGYSNVVGFQPADLPFRPLPFTRKPVIEGSQTAIVSGPKSEEIYTDEYGRVKLKFHWDRGNSPEDRTSCWVRVAQTWAGKGWGSVFIPRIGQEVIVDFLEGDPDRPIITGSVYNGSNPTPYTLPDKKTVSTIRSDSSLGSKGFNEFRFEDMKDKEEIFQHAQKDLTIVTENCKSQQTGNDETLTVGHDRTKTVKNAERSTIEGNRIEAVLKNENVTVTGNRSVIIEQGKETLEVKTGDRQVDVNTGNDTLNVKSGNREVNVEAKDSILNVNSGSRIVTIKSKDDILTIESGNRSAKIDSGNDDLTIGSGKRTTTIKQNDELEADKLLVTTHSETTLKTGSSEEKITTDRIEISSDTIVLKATKEIQIKVGSSTIKLSATGIDITTSGILTQKGSFVKIN
jgi:type VI secretion system secreted protein VgrG